MSGECQALLLNFDELLVAEFGNYFAIRDSISVPLQTASVRTGAQTEALRKLQARHFDEVKAFIDNFREALPSTVFDDQRYSFRVFLVPKVGNHRNSSDIAVDFIRMPENPEDAKELQRQLIAIREKQVPVANADLLKVKEVVKEVSAKIGRPFNPSNHFTASVRYGVRKAGKFDPASCDPRYCVPDPLHRDYGYTRAWVAFLSTKLSDPAEYAAVIKRASILES